MIRKKLPVVITLMSAIWLSAPTSQARAHEYWLNPIEPQWRVGDTLEADIRNGEDLAGTALPFNPDAFARAGLISDSARRPLSGQSGDYPGFQMPLQETGLHLLLLETRRREITYADIDDFEQFLNDHLLTGFLEQHRQRALPVTQIVESYYRYAKALIYVTADTDQQTDNTPSSSSAALQAQDQHLELLVEDSPFGTDTVRARLLFRGAPLPDRQIKLFHRDVTASVQQSFAITDEQGYAEFNVAASGDYLLNSVWIEESQYPSSQWATSWASLFFRQVALQED